MVKKAPRKTAERILEVTLGLFNRFGEPNVSTTLISAELGISPGNLYYHFPAKDELVNALFDRYEQRLDELLHASAEVDDIESAWFFVHTFFELIWDYRFLYRDLNDLLSKNRHLETHFQKIIGNKERALLQLLQALIRSRCMQMEPSVILPTARNMVIMLTYWLSYEYVQAPRLALEPEHASQALTRGAQHVLNLLVPFAQGAHRLHLVDLVSAYDTSTTPQAI